MKYLSKEEMEKLLIENSDYENILVPFKFGTNIYEAQVNFAYMNTCIAEIYEKWNIPFSEDDMLKDSMVYKNYLTFMNNIVRNKLYYRNINLQVSQDIMLEFINLFSKVVNFIDDGNQVSQDLSLIAICNAMAKDKEVYDLFMTEWCNEKMTPEEIRDTREMVLAKVKSMHIPGISDLLNSGSSVKSDQMMNMFFGLHMRVKPSDDLNEIYPYFIKDRWIDGLSTRESQFIEATIQRLAAVFNSQTMQSSGTHNKEASILAQDCEIVAMDCGSINYMTYLVEDQTDLNALEFKYRLDENTNKLVEIKPSDTFLIGSEVKVRSALKCALPQGVCATCYGSNAKWNLSNDRYRFDVGFVSARYMNSGRSQKVLSIKHTSTPTLKDCFFTIVNLEDGEIIEIKGSDYKKDNPFFTREFNNIIFKDNVDKVWFDVTDVLKRKKKKAKKEDKSFIGYFDGEFGDWTIIRTNVIYFSTKDGKKYIMDNNSPFRIKGFDRTVTKFWDNGDIVEVNNIKTDVSYVIRNDESVTDFKKIRRVYNLNTDQIKKISKEEFGENEVRNKTAPYLKDQLRYMYESIKPVIKGDPISVFECALRNKIRDEKDPYKLPDWTKPNPPYALSTSKVSMGEKPSISSVLPRGYIYQRLTDVIYHDVENIRYSVFDNLFTRNMDDINGEEDYLGDDD